MLAQFLLLFWVWSMFLPGSSPKQQLVIKPMPLSWEALEPITWSVHLPYILESTFASIFLFLEQFSSQASLNSQESVFYSALYCAVSGCQTRPWQEKDTRKRCLIRFVWEMEAPGDGLLSLSIQNCGQTLPCGFISCQFRGSIYWNAHASSSLDLAHWGYKNVFKTDTAF